MRPLKELWLLAQDVQYLDIPRWKDKTLFHTFPPKCAVCGREWRPRRDREFYYAQGKCMMVVAIPIDMWDALEWPEGVIRLRPIWYYDRMNIERSTGNLTDDSRPICKEHGDMLPPGVIHVQDSYTEEFLDLRPKHRKLYRHIKRICNDIAYWVDTTRRFIVLSVGGR